MQERWFDVIGDGGIRLRAREMAGPGRAAPTLLLHHGLASSQRIWDLMLPGLRRTFRVVTFDARGHGLSAKPTSGYGFDDTIDDAMAVLHAARLRKPVIVGHSWGAMVAAPLAARHPRAVRGVVLIDGGVATRDGRPPWSEFKANLAPPQLSGTPLEEFRSNLHRWSPIPVTEEVEAIFLSLMRVDGSGRIRPRLSRANHFRILRAIWQSDPVEPYRRLRVPTLAILARSGDEGWDRSKRAGVRAIREAGVPAQVTWIAGVHDLPLQHPAALVRRIRRFAAGAVR